MDLVFFYCVINMNYIYILYIIGILCINSIIHFYIWQNNYNIEKKKLFSTCILIIVICILLTLFCRDVFFFLIIYELSFLPIVIGFFWFNTANRLLISIYYLFIVNTMTSILTAIFCCCFCVFFNFVFFSNNLCLHNTISCFLILLLFLIFSLKYPIFPFHWWLPEVHVEASTEISIVLASVILKVGFYGFLKFFVFEPFLFLICLLVLLSFVFFFWHILFFFDYKKLVAYLSIFHTNLAIILVFSYENLCILIFCIGNFLHIFTSFCLFFFFGWFYSNNGFRSNITFFNVICNNFYCFFSYLILLINIDFPFFVGFIVEILCVSQLLNVSSFFCFWVLCCIYLLFVCAVWLFCCINYTAEFWRNNFLKVDFSINECFIILFNIIILIFFFFFTYYIF
uniref:NADH-ubiquinone oxidoreductase chain 4 n=1 Tax=Blastocrithidia nonstop TaxID=2592485 RepID=A0AAT9UQA8_9TRYP